jgi:hypothetical protein
MDNAIGTALSSPPDVILQIRNIQRLIPKEVAICPECLKGGPDYLDLALVWHPSRHDMYTFRSEAGRSTRILPFPPKGVSERISRFL